VEVAELAEGAVDVALLQTASGAANWETELLEIRAVLAQLGNIRVGEFGILVIPNIAVFNVPGLRLWRKDETA
jgi:hypothetical protein